MAKIIIQTDTAPPSPGPYSQAVQAAGLIFVAGQGPFDARSGAVVGSTIQEQTAQCLRNITAILHAAGSSLDQAVSATFILADPSDFAGMNDEWARWFPSDPPARQGARHPLAGQGPRISIALVAVAGPTP